MALPTALTIAGTDPTGGAGINADLRVFSAHRVHGTAVVTNVIAQSTLRVRSQHVLSAGLVADQLEELLADLPIHAAKTGVLGNAQVIEVLAAILAKYPFPLVIDPVLASSSGAILLDVSGVSALRSKLFPRASLITPNLFELFALAEQPFDFDQDARVEAARKLIRHGVPAVLVKGGHLDGPPTDVLVTSLDVHVFAGTRIESKCTRGTGCALSAAITARLARGSEMVDAIKDAKFYLEQAIRQATPIGHGPSPMFHLWPLEG